MSKINAAFLRSLYGKRIKYLLRYDICPYRKTEIWRTGTVGEVLGRNVLIGGDYRWIPSIVKIETPTNPQNEKES